ncbi:hypothetical protein QOT17_021657 [Balamuthia mandrillaris]
MSFVLSGAVRTSRAALGALGGGARATRGITTGGLLGNRIACGPLLSEPANGGGLAFHRSDRMYSNRAGGKEEEEGFEDEGDLDFEHAERGEGEGGGGSYQDAITEAAERMQQRSINILQITSDVLQDRDNFYLKKQRLKQRKQAYFEKARAAARKTQKEKQAKKKKKVVNEGWVAPSLNARDMFSNQDLVYRITDETLPQETRDILNERLQSYAMAIGKNPSWDYREKRRLMERMARFFVRACHTDMSQYITADTPAPDGKVYTERPLPEDLEEWERDPAQDEAEFTKTHKLAPLPKGVAVGWAHAE